MFPACTSSSVTVPATLKLRPRVADAWTVPAADAVIDTVPRRTVDTVLATVFGAAPGPPAIASAPIATTTTTSVIDHAVLDLNRREGVSWAAQSASLMLGESGGTGSRLAQPRLGETSKPLMSLDRT